MIAVDPLLLGNQPSTPQALTTAAPTFDVDTSTLATITLDANAELLLSGTISALTDYRVMVTATADATLILSADYTVAKGGTYNHVFKNGDVRTLEFIGQGSKLIMTNVIEESA